MYSLQKLEIYGYQQEAVPHPFFNNTSRPIMQPSSFPVCSIPVRDRYSATPPWSC